MVENGKIENEVTTANEAGVNKMEQNLAKDESLKPSESVKKSFFSSVMSFLFKEPRKEGQGAVAHFVRQAGRMVFFANLICLGLVYFTDFIFYKLFSIDLDFFSFFYISIITFFVSCIFWKGELNNSSYHHTSIGGNNHKSTNFHNHSKESRSWTTNPAYSSTRGNIYSRR